MTASAVSFRPLSDATFGVLAEVGGGQPETAADRFVAAGETVLNRFYDAGGLMVVRGLDGMANEPDQLVRVSALFGDEVENYRFTLTDPRYFHDMVPEVMVLSNLAPCNHPPPRRFPAEKNGRLAVRFPARTNWHTDQSYRRPPPDVSLLFGVMTPPSDQGQTLYADCHAAYDALDGETKALIGDLNGLHVASWVGRTPDDVRAGVRPRPLLAHQRPQRQPMVRRHPVTGRPALYICEEKQMDYVDGPVEGLEPGPDGEGAILIRRLLAHATQPAFTYVHEWQEGDLVIADNRSLLHAASWYDADQHDRIMWRTTVMGSPGAEYAGETKSWIPADAETPILQGMEDH